MNHSPHLLLAVMAVLLMLAGGSYSQAAPLSQDPVPGQPGGQEGVSPAAGCFWQNQFLAGRDFVR